MTRPDHPPRRKAQMYDIAFNRHHARLRVVVEHSINRLRTRTLHVA